jgi:hypothetical protein
MCYGVVANPARHREGLLRCSEGIADLVRHGDTDWFGGEQHLTPD